MANPALTQKSKTDIGAGLSRSYRLRVKPGLSGNPEKSLFPFRIPAVCGRTDTAAPAQAVSHCNPPRAACRKRFVNPVAGPGSLH